jgi:hypothetical protein
MIAGCPPAEANRNKDGLFNRGKNAAYRATVGHFLKSVCDRQTLMTCDMQHSVKDVKPEKMFIDLVSDSDKDVKLT